MSACASETRPYRTLVFCGLLAALFALVGDASPVDAQEVKCERLTYNERIVLQCETVPDGSGGTSIATTTPTPEPTATPEPDATSTPEPEASATAEAETEDDGDDEPEVADDAGGPTPTSEPESEAPDQDQATNRGDRGGRGGADDLPDPANTSAAEEPSEAEPADDGTARDDQPGDADGQASTTDAASNAGATSRDFVFDTTPDPEPSTLPLTTATIGLFALGAVLFLAARRVNSDGSRIAS